MKSFVALVRRLLSIGGIDYLLSAKLNQDPLEQYFSKQRGCIGRNDNPTVGEFGINNLRIIVGGEAIRASKYGNVTLLQQ